MTVHQQAPEAAGDRVPVGCRELTAQGAPVLVVHPASGPPGRTVLEGHEVAAASDAAVLPGRWPLVVVSHGSRGSRLTHHRLATQLAARGFVVAVPEHPGDNRADASLTGDPANLPARVATLVATTAAVSGDPVLGDAVDGSRLGLVGHSMGAATVLTAAGATPWSLPGEGSGAPGPLPVRRRLEARAVVALAPAVPWLDRPGSLDAVRAPVLALAAQHDALAPAAYHLDVLRRLLPGRPAGSDGDQLRTVPGAGHFSFLSPFPAARRGPHLPPSMDPDGFDREAYAAALADEVHAFLTHHLGD